MIFLRSTVTAILKNKNTDQILLIKRAANKKIAPNVWSGIGGHIEQSEMNNPETACYREIYEETGIKQTEIFNLKLKYIIMRKAADEIRLSYIYFGETSSENVFSADYTDEGELHWIDEKDLLKREFTKTFDEMFRHYTIHRDECGKDDNIYVGVAGAVNDKINMVWSVIEDFEK